MILLMATFHISEAEAAGNFAGLMARVRSGMDIVIEEGTQPIAVIQAAMPPRRSVSECIALAKKYEEETGQSPVLDDDFAQDVEEVIRGRKPLGSRAWD